MSAPAVNRPVPGPPPARPVPSPPPQRGRIACGHCHGRHASVDDVRACSRSSESTRWNSQRHQG